MIDAGERGVADVEGAGAPDAGARLVFGRLAVLGDIEGQEAIAIEAVLAVLIVAVLAAGDPTGAGDGVGAELAVDDVAGGPGRVAVVESGQELVSVGRGVAAGGGAGEVKALTELGGGGGGEGVGK